MAILVLKSFPVPRAKPRKLTVFRPQTGPRGMSVPVLPYVAKGCSCPGCDGNLMFYPDTKKFVCSACPPGDVAVSGKVVRAC
jgi:hypothetical protein